MHVGRSRARGAPQWRKLPLLRNPNKAWKCIGAKECSGAMEDVARAAIYIENTGVKSCSDFVTADKREKVFEQSFVRLALTLILFRT